MDGLASRRLLKLTIRCELHKTCGVAYPSALASSLWVRSTLLTAQSPGPSARKLLQRSLLADNRPWQRELRSVLEADHQTSSELSLGTSLAERSLVPEIYVTRTTLPCRTRRAEGQLDRS